MHERYNLPSEPIIFSNPRYIQGSAENTETLTRFSQGLAELQSQHPEILGATLSGSRLKGTSSEASDVDCRVLVDADFLEQQGATAIVDDLGMQEWSDDGAYAYELEDRLSKKLAADTEKDWLTIRKGIIVEPMSEKLLSEQLEKCVQAKQAGCFDHLDAINRWSASGNMGPRPIAPPPVDIGSAIPALFAPDLIPGLEKYRELVVRQLDEAGKPGPLVWVDIINRLEFGEGHLDINDRTLYPRYFVDAQQWYPPTE